MRAPFSAEWEPLFTTTAHEDAWPLLGQNQNRRSGVLMRAPFSAEWEPLFTTTAHEDA